MIIDPSRAGRVIPMNMRCADPWFSILENTDEAHYGTEIPDFEIDCRARWVNVPAKTFAFERGTSSRGVRWGSSAEGGGAAMNVRLAVGREGTFEFGKSLGLDVESLYINKSLDRFGDRVRARVAG